MDTESFRFAYDHGPIRFGPGCVDALSAEVAGAGADRALVVAGETTGTTESVVGPVRAGLGDRLAGVYAGTTPEKTLATAFEVVDAMAAHDADALVGLGGGSSIDLATVASVLAASDRSRADLAETFAETGTVPVSEGSLPPVVAVPTTLAGADLSMVAGLSLAPERAPDGERVHGGVADPRLVPAALFSDPELVATTPGDVLAASAMNGFDKGVETLYAAAATPVTDATAVRGLGLLRSGLPALGAGRRDEATMARVCVGTLLVQYGTSRPDASTLSVIHAFGHGLSRGYDLQQGTAHAVAAPHVLRYVFEAVDARRHLLAEALGVDGDGDVADAVVEAVADVRDGLGLPSRLCDVDGPTPEEFDAVAAVVVEDSLIGNGPSDLAPSEPDVAAVLEAMW